jgi:hypothetical protein
MAFTIRTDEYRNFLKNINSNTYFINNNIIVLMTDLFNKIEVNCCCF